MEICMLNFFLASNFPGGQHFLFYSETLKLMEVLIQDFLTWKPFFRASTSIYCLHTLNYASPTLTASETRDAGWNRWKTALHLLEMNERMKKLVYGSNRDNVHDIFIIDRSSRGNESFM